MLGVLFVPMLVPTIRTSELFVVVVCALLAVACWSSFCGGHSRKWPSQKTVKKYRASSYRLL